MDTLSIALTLLLMIESGDKVDAKGDYSKYEGHKAIGCLQTWKVTVDDANRILGKKVFTYADRKDRGKSLEIARTILKHYCSEKRLGRKATIEDYVRVWKVRAYKGETSGIAKTRTDSHWQKARALIMDRSYVDTLMTVMPPTVVENEKLKDVKNVREGA